MHNSPHQQGFTNAELDRRLNQIITIGTILDVDHQAKKLRVKIGDNETDWLPWPAEVGRNFRRWRPLKAGQQLILAAPSGDLAQAAIVGMLYSDTIDAPSTDENVDLIHFEDGTEVEYNIDSHELAISVKGNVTISANEIKHIANKHIIIGPVEQTGGDMTSDGISAQNHVHGGVAKGAAKTEIPE